MRGSPADHAGAAHLWNRQAKPGVGIRLQLGRHHDCRIRPVAAGGGVRGHGSLEPLRRGELDAIGTRGAGELSSGEPLRPPFLSLVIGVQQAIVNRKAGYGGCIVQAQLVHHLESMFLDGLDASSEIPCNSLA